MVAGGVFCLNLRPSRAKKGGKAELRIQSVPLQKSDWSGRSTFVRQFILKFWQSLANTPATAVEEVVAKAAAASSDRSFQQIQAYSSSLLQFHSAPLYLFPWLHIIGPFRVSDFNTTSAATRLHCSRTSVGPFQKRAKGDPAEKHSG